MKVASPDQLSELQTLHDNSHLIVIGQQQRMITGHTHMDYLLVSFLEPDINPLGFDHRTIVAKSQATAQAMAHGVQIPGVRQEQAME